MFLRHRGNTIHPIFGAFFHRPNGNALHHSWRHLRGRPSSRAARRASELPLRNAELAGDFRERNAFQVGGFGFVPIDRKRLRHVTPLHVSCGSKSQTVRA